MNNFLLLPPIAFLIILLFVFLQIYLFGKFSCRGKEGLPGKGKQYACGEDAPLSTVGPEYKQFFSFAFFFTIMHVIALVVTTFPSGSAMALTFAFIYVIGGITCLFILFRRS